jgi:hypothetical protein
LNFASIIARNAAQAIGSWTGYKPLARYEGRLFNLGGRLLSQGFELTREQNGKTVALVKMRE